MQENHITEEDRVGGIAVILHPDDPEQGWLEALFPLNEIHLYPGENPDDPTMVGVQFDFKSGSVCMLLNAVQMAHDHLTNALGADHD